jgi:hypothetical protein
MGACAFCSACTFVAATNIMRMHARCSHERMSSNCVPTYDSIYRAHGGDNSERTPGRTRDSHSAE